MPAVLNFIRSWSFWRIAHDIVFGPPVHWRSADDPKLVVLGHPEGARHDNIAPLIEEGAVVVKNLDAGIVPVGHIDPPVRIHRDGVGEIEITGSEAQFSPALDELAVLVVLDDAGVAITIGDEDIASRRDYHVCGLEEVTLIAARDAGSTQGAEQLAIRGTLQDDMLRSVGDPDMALAVQGEHVRPADQLLVSPGLNELAVGLIDLHEWKRNGLKPRRCPGRQQPGRFRVPSRCPCAFRARRDPLGR